MLNKKKIPYAILKGTSVSVYYPNPEVRVLGDIDILFKPADCKIVVDLLSENGYKNLNKNPKNRDMNLIVHEAMESGNTVVEPHYKIARLPANNAGKNIELALSNIFEHIETESIHPYTFSVLSAKHQAIALLLHMERHFSHEGVGLRHLCDWAMFVYKKTSNDFWCREIQPVLEQCGLFRFAKALTKTCVIYLGLSSEKCPWCLNIDSTICEQLILFMLKSGNFGRKAPELKTTTPLSVEKSKMKKYKSSIGIISSNIIFIAKRDFPICRKLSIAVPFLCVYVLIRNIYKYISKKNMNISILKALNIAKKQKKLFNDLKIYEV